MQSTNSLGTIIRRYRKAKAESVADLAKSVGVERAYLNKIELDVIKPSVKLLDKILEHFSVDKDEALRIQQLAGHQPIGQSEGGKEDNMSHANANQLVAPQQQSQIAVNPMQTPVLYTDSVFVSSNNFGLVLDVAQTVGGQQQTVVARIGMSFEHAKKLLEVMKDNLEKHER